MIATDETYPPTNSKQLLDQVGASINKKKLESIKAKLTTIHEKIDEHRRSIRQLEVESNDLISKHEAGIL